MIDQAQYDAAVRELVTRHNLFVKELTERQLVEAIRQAISSGDFVRFVRECDLAQQVVYIPFAREAELEARIRELEEELNTLKQQTKNDSASTGK